MAQRSHSRSFTRPLAALWFGLSSLAAGGADRQLPEQPVATQRLAEQQHNGPQLNGQKFTLPDGFEIVQAAGTDLVERPISVDFDERGRLYVTESSGTNDKSDIQLINKPHRVLRLEDTDGDGVFDRRTVFADQLMFPEGALWHQGALYVSAPPSIWKLIDTDDDGVADRREEWHAGVTLGGCANDLHGPFLGPDGWIYWCKGAWAEQTIERPGRPPFVTKASHIFRKRVDGTGQEAVMTGGMDNPVDVAFTAGGERIITSTFVQHPGGGRRDGLLHTVYGGVYGKDHAPIDSAPRTGELMPILVHLGAAAPCGLIRYESNSFGEKYRDNLFACLFNMHKITRHELTPNGGSFAVKTTDFLVSDSLDFHPTDVQEDADGSLLVIDTGGWYKLCCPTSQLWKPDVLGAIYRVRRTQAPVIPDPRGLRIPFAKLNDGAALARFLADRRPAVRARATAALVGLAEPAVPALRDQLSDSNPRVRLRVVRALSELAEKLAGTPSAEAPLKVLRQALGDDDETVRQAAGHAVSLAKDPQAVDALQTLLQSPSLSNRRVAAEALGRIQTPAAIPALLAAAAAPPEDRFVEHSVTYALLEIGAAGELRAWLGQDPELTHLEPRSVRAALLALEQLPEGGLTVEPILQLLRRDDEISRETALWIARRHPEWGADLAAQLGPLLHRVSDLADEPARARLRNLLVGLARSPQVQQLLGELAVAETTPSLGRSVILEAMRDAGLKPFPEEWVRSVVAVLGRPDNSVRAEALQALRGQTIPPDQQPAVSDAILRLAREESAPSSLRRQALANAPAGSGPLDAGLLALVSEPLNGDAPVPDRLEAIEILQRASLTVPQRQDLARFLSELGPLEVDRLLGVFRDQTDADLGRAVLDALKNSAALSNLRLDAVQTTFGKFPEEIRGESQGLLDQINAESGRQKEKLASVLERLRPLSGDVRRGQAVFHSNKAACSTCHAMGYLGGSVGPDLTRIGGVRSEQDLLESILFPSLSFVRSYEPVIVATREGKTVSGNLRSEGPDGVVLTTGPRQEVRIDRDMIEEIRPGNVSVMPSGLDQQLSDQDLADLLSFLKGAK
jgi:putative membrane-bound dehydrogenase-like protein